MFTNISGFPEFSPQWQLAFNSATDLIKNVFESYGFLPLDTVAVEKIDTLLSKGDDNEIYGLYRIAGDEGNKKDLGLRFDLTVPLARYVGQNYGKLIFPYRRYHIAPVWRGERPQAGRYRQFYQCDVDIIGDEDLSMIHDAELISITYDILSKFGLEDFAIQVNNSKLIIGLLKYVGVSLENIPMIMRIIDKMDKISREQMKQELEKCDISSNHVEQLFSIIDAKHSASAVIPFLYSLGINNQDFSEGVIELQQLLEYVSLFEISSKYIEINLGLARGLSYYTGTIYETRLKNCPEIGNIAGGGRYANLAGNFINRKLPGVGISIGISRLFPKLIEWGLIPAASSTIAEVLITVQNVKFLEQYIMVAQILRQNGIKAEMYMQDKSLSGQMKYANKKGFKFAIIADEGEINRGKVIVKNLLDGSQTELFFSDVVDFLLGGKVKD